MSSGLSLQMRLTLMAGAVSLTGLVVFGATMMYFNQQSLQAELAQDVEMMSRQIAYSARAAVTFDDPQAASDSLSVLAITEHVQHACIRDVVGADLACWSAVDAAESVIVEPVELGSVFQKDLLTVAVPIGLDAGGPPIGQVVLQSSLDPITDELRTEAIIIFAGLLAALLASMGLSFMLRRAIVRPLQDLADTAETVTAGGDYSVRASHGADDEVGALVHAFNRMLAEVGQRDSALTAAKVSAEQASLEMAYALEQRQKLEDELVQTRKLESIGRLAGGVAHDFNNLLTSIIANVDLAEEDLGPEHPSLRYLIDIGSASERAAELTKQLLIFARKQTLQPKVLDLNDVVRESSRILKRLLPETITLTTRTEDDGCPVMADPGQLSQLVMNLVVNARDALPEGGRITLSTLTLSPTECLDIQVQSGLLPPDDYVCLAVEDNGTGIPEDIRDRLFDPFFTTKAAGKGTGLGLATCYGIVKQARGHLALQTDLETGTIFRVFLPLQSEQSGTGVGARGPRLRLAHRGGLKLLLVEDEEPVRRVIRLVLEREGHSVTTALDGAQALELVQTTDATFDLLITDVLMPRLTGPELVVKVRKLWPDVPVLFVSGYTDRDLHSDQIPNSKLLHKPFGASTLLAAVASMVTQQNAANGSA